MSVPVVIEVSPPRGYSAYEIAVQHGYVGTEEEWNAAVNSERIAAEEAAAAASDSADSAAEAAQQTAADRVATGEIYYNTTLKAYRYFNGAVFDYVTPDGDYLLL